MNPPLVDVGVPKVGVRAALRLVPLTVALPPTYPVRVVVMVVTLAVLAATPVTVTRPVPELMATEPLAVADPAQVYAAS